MDRSNPESLTCEGVEVRFGSLCAVDGASLSVAAGEIVALLGRSGSGKTTLLRAIAGFERATAGEIRIGGNLIESATTSIPAHRRSVGLVFQEYALFPNKTVAGNLAYGLGRGASERVEELLRTGQLEGLAGRYPHQLSGGQQQRVALLRSLAPYPRVLLLDEPFSNLDAGLRLAMREEVAAILRAASMTAVLVTHDRADAMAIADRIAVMEAGRVIELATPSDLYFRPASAAAAGYGGEAQFLSGTARGETAETPLGEVTLANPFEGPCRLLLRPEWLAPGPGAPVTVVARRFEGAHTRLTIRAQDGALAAMTVDSATPQALDDHLCVAVRQPLPAYPPEA